MNKKTIFQESIDLQLKAKEIGLDWLEVDGVINKLSEETDEVIEAITSGDRLAIKEELGDRWLQPDLFRFGASSLLGDIERQLEHHVSGHYSANHRHAVG